MQQPTPHSFTFAFLNTAVLKSPLRPHPTAWGEAARMTPVQSSNLVAIPAICPQN